MAVKLLHCRGRNLFIEGLNLGIVLVSASVPMPSEAYDSFTPGGANGAIDIATNAEPIEVTVKTKGIHPELLPYANLPYGQRAKCTLLGALVNEYAETATERARQLTATFYGRMTPKVDDLEATAAEGTEYVFKSIAKYVLNIAPTEIYRYNAQQGGWQRGDQSAEINQMIGLVG